MKMLIELFNAIHESIETSSAAEIRDACKLIIEVQAFGQAEVSCIKAAYNHGPLFDGDVPSKIARDVLVANGFMSRVVVKGEDGFNACTYKGAWAYRLLEAGAHTLFSNPQS